MSQAVPARRSRRDRATVRTNRRTLEVGAQRDRPLDANSAPARILILPSGAISAKRGIQNESAHGQQAGRSSRECPLWVRSGHRAVSGRCPLYPRKQTSLDASDTSAWCQKRTLWRNGKGAGIAARGPRFQPIVWNRAMLSGRAPVEAPDRRPKNGLLGVLTCVRESSRDADQMTDITGPPATCHEMSASARCPAEPNEAVTKQDYGIAMSKPTVTPSDCSCSAPKE